MDRIRASTAASLPPTIDVRHVPELLSAWRPATVEEEEEEEEEFIFRTKTKHKNE